MRTLHPLFQVIVAWPLLGASALLAADTPALDSASTWPAAIDLQQAPVLVDQAMEQALQKLADGDIRGFTVGYLAAVKSYAQFAQQLHNHAPITGAADAELKWASAEAKRLQSAPANSSPRTWPQMSKVRGQMLMEIQALRQQHQAASTAQRPAIQWQLGELEAWLGDLDQWLTGSSSNQQVDTHLPMEHFTQRVQLLQRQLPLDHQLQELAAVVLTEALDQSQADLERALDVMLANESLPTSTLAQLRRTTGQMRDILQQVQSARTQALQTARKELTQGTSTVNWEELQQRVDRLLGPMSSSFRPVTTAPRRCRP
jgi:hypothetical protein